MISKELKRKVFEVASRTFETENIRNYFLDMSEFIPDYFFTMPSSTTGKYHSAQQCEPCGQLVHAYMLQAYWDVLLALDSIREDMAPTPKDRDLIRCFPFLHDAVKCGWDGSKYTVPEHPKLGANLIHERQPEHNISAEDKVFLSGLIATHSGQWNKNRKGEEIMPCPRTYAEKMCHYSDMFCSRKYFLYDLSEDQKEIIAEIRQTENTSTDNEPQSASVEVDPSEQTMPFGRYKGWKFADIRKDEKGVEYLQWMVREMGDQPRLQKLAAYVLQAR